jgi:hypothetical protein
LAISLRRNINIAAGERSEPAASDFIIQTNDFRSNNSAVSYNSSIGGGAPTLSTST